PGLLIRHPPHRAKPRGERRARILEDRAGRDRGLVPTSSALKQDLSDRPRFLLSATWTAKAIRPAKPHEILATRRLGREPPLELGEIWREILHGAGHYMLGSPESSE